MNPSDGLHGSIEGAECLHEEEETRISPGTALEPQDDLFPPVH